MRKQPPANPAHLRFAVLATDVVLFTIKDGELLVRLMTVDRPPFFVNAEGLPGGLIDPKETAEDTARRITESKAHISPDKAYFEQLYTFSRIDRDPRGRVVAVAYIGLVPWEKLSPSEQANDETVWWAPAREARGLAYDHDEVLSMAIDRLRARSTYTTLISKLMPLMFTLTELEQNYEKILHVELDKRNFRKKILKLNILTALPEKRSGGAFRPAQLYKFTSGKVREIEIL